jgi:prolyl 4-hydroxylase
MFRLCAFALLAATLAAVQGQDSDYGVDCSFPIHSKEWRCGDTLGDRAKFYEDFMQGCHNYYGNKANRCDITEDDRIEMSLRQPQSMVNYTSTGYKKIKAPKLLFDLLSAHWEANKHLKTQEVWFVGNTYTNHWESPTNMVSVEDGKLRGAGAQLKITLWDAVKSTIEEWTGMEQKPTSMYGIREYTTGALLAPHVDRLPLVSSCIVNVAQDLDEDWPLEIYDREGKGKFMLTTEATLLRVLLVEKAD